MSKKMKQFGDSKVKIIPTVKEIVYKTPVTEGELKEAEENRKNIEDMIVDMFVNYIKKNN